MTWSGTTRSALDRQHAYPKTGTLPHSRPMRSIELYATEVIPRVRELR